MNKFHVLLRFSVRKRLKNRTFLITNVLLVLVMLGVMFADWLILKWDPDFFQPQTIYVYQLADFHEFALKQTTDLSFALLEDLDNREDLLSRGAWILQKDEAYQVISKTDFSPMDFLKLQQLVLQYEEEVMQTNVSAGEYLSFTPLQMIPIVLDGEKEKTQDQTWAFLIITGIYFIALSYAGMAASDVVYEKSTRMMELILTSVSSTVHLIAKLMSGWLVLIIQILILIAGGSLAFAMRFLLDRGRGWIDLMIHFNLLPNESVSDFGEILRGLISNTHLLPKIFIALLLMLLGILLVQTILVILSSFIGSIEESGTIQSPFYLLFMGVYYLTLLLNTPQHMKEGLGKTLSMMPFFSMLFMPCRMFYYDASFMEMMIALVSASASLIALWLIGAPLYQQGVLDYSAKPVHEKLRSSLAAFLAKLFFQHS